MTPEESVRGFFSTNWKLKASALGLSMFLWALVRLDGSAPETIPVPIEIRLGADSWAVVAGPDPDHIQVRFEGPISEIYDLRGRGTPIVVPVDEVFSSDTVIFLRREWLQGGTPPGLTILELNPTSIRLGFQRRIVRSLPVAPRLLGRLPDGFALSSPIEALPQLVEVQAPSGLLAARDSLFLMPLDLSRIRGTDTVQVAVDTTGMEGMTFTDSIVRLSFTVEESVSAILGDVAVGMMGAPGATDLEVSPQSVTVELVGAKSLVDGIDLTRVTARVDVSGIEDLVPGGRRELDVTVRGVPALVEVRVVPPTVAVRRTRAP